MNGASFDEPNCFNPEKDRRLNICINDQTHDRGFFSFFNQVLDALDWADKNNKLMAVDFSHGPFAYGKWDDYFEQQHYGSLNGKNNTFIGINKQMWFDSRTFSSNFFLSDEQIKRGAYLVNKYIKIKLCAINFPLIKGNDTLGVHCRQTDHGLHGELLPVSYYIENAKRVMKENGLQKVYLATDSFHAQQDFLDAFSGNQLIIQSNTCKSINQSPIQVLGFDPERIGREALTDVLNLSKCDYFLKTASNLSHAVLFFNPNLKYENIDSHIEYK